MSDPLTIPGAARVAAGAFVAGAGLIGGLWAWTARSPMPPPPPSESVVLWPSEPESVVEPSADPQPAPTPEIITPPPNPPETTETRDQEDQVTGPTPIPVAPDPEGEPDPIDAPEEDLPSMPIDAGPAAEPSSTTPTTPEPTAPVAPAVQRIDINAAGNAELQLLPGIGPVLAQRIIDDRVANGRFGSLNDLQRVKGIGEKTAAKLAPLITFN